jgi:hypothetical protein
VITCTVLARLVDRASTVVYHPAMQPRRLQPAITIRSQKAVDRLKLLTRNGRSQTAVIEEALEKMAEPKPTDDVAQREAEIRVLIERLSKRIPPIPSMTEFDAREYDERGNLR